jgi:hypothetical protein
MSREMSALLKQRNMWGGKTRVKKIKVKEAKVVVIEVAVEANKINEDLSNVLILPI